MFDGTGNSDQTMACGTAGEVGAPPMGASGDLAALLRSVGAGDQRAFQRLYQLTSSRLLGRAVSMLSSRDAAEDTMQEAFVRIWTHARQFDEARGHPMAWMMRILRNAVIDRLRRDRIVARYQVSDADIPDLPAARDMVDERHDLMVALARLPIEQRETIWQVVVQGWTHGEVALREGIPTPTAKARAQRGLKRLRVALDDERADCALVERYRAVA